MSISDFLVELRRVYTNNWNRSELGNLQEDRQDFNSLCAYILGTKHSFHRRNKIREAVSFIYEKQI